jgi:hypothetical protein
MDTSDWEMIKKKVKKEKENTTYSGCRVFRCEISLQRTPFNVVDWDWRGAGEKGGVDGFALTEGHLVER